jgi:hypothetical protein
MTSDDPWARLAEEQISAPRKAVLKGVQTRRERAIEKALDDKQTLYKQWQEWHAKRKKELLAGDFATPAGEVAEFVERMTLRDGAALVALVENGPWHHADADTRYQVLALVSHAITNLREQMGMSPFDDPILSSEKNVFLTIRDMLK